MSFSSSSSPPPPTWIIGNTSTTTTTTTNDDDFTTNHCVTVQIPFGSSIQCASHRVIVSYDCDDSLEIIRQSQKFPTRGKKTKYDNNNNNNNHENENQNDKGSIWKWWWWWSSKLSSSSSSMTPICILHSNNNNNNKRTAAATVLLSPKKLVSSASCSIVMHLLENTRSNSSDTLWISRDAYLASDSTIQWIDKEKQTAAPTSSSNDANDWMKQNMIQASVIGNGQDGGYIAISGLGSIHKYVLKRKETRTIQMGHLIAYTPSIQCTGIVKEYHHHQGNNHRNRHLQESVEFFKVQGPGIVYVQSHSIQDELAMHKSLSSSSSTTNINVDPYHPDYYHHHHHYNNRNPNSNASKPCRSLLKFLMIVFFCFVFEVSVRAYELSLVRRLEAGQQMLQQQPHEHSPQYDKLRYYGIDDGRSSSTTTTNDDSSSTQQTTTGTSKLKDSSSSSSSSSQDYWQEDEL